MPGGQYVHQNLFAADPQHCKTSGLCPQPFPALPKNIKVIIKFIDHTTVVSLVTINNRQPKSHPLTQPQDQVACMDRGSGEESPQTQVPLVPQKTEKVQLEPQHSQIILHLYHREHLNLYGRIQAHLQR